MCYTRVAVVFIVLIMISSIFVANVTNFISIDSSLSKKYKVDSSNNEKWSKEQKNFQIDDKSDHLMWFLQISDLHVSIFNDHKRVSHLKEFCTTTVDAINPSVILASGDLTDAKTENHLGSKQFEKEWQIYNNVLVESKILEKTEWLDIRGNHDNFNVPGENTQFNYYLNYSMQGKQNKRSYLKQIKKGAEKYSFIAVDACLDPGPKRPFNFIGLLKNEDMEQIIDLATLARENGGNYTIWFGHYPTSCILSPGVKSGGMLRDVIGRYEEGFAYLCGHLHTMGGMVPKMHTLQKSGFLELELGDWKDNRIFRVAAVDHGLFSFVDVVHNEWPIVLITNPKNALYNIPSRENPQLQLDSTHIRILAFSLSDIVECSVRINLNSWQNCKKITKHLFVRKWDPRHYGAGIHNIEVIVKDKQGRSKSISQPFSLDGSRLQFSHMARFVLMTDACQIFQALFGIMLIVCILPLCGFRVWHILVQHKILQKPRIKNNCVRNWIRKLWILSTVDRIFLPVILYCVYLTLGPWSIGELIDGHIGVIFAWGLFVKGSYLPGSLTYLYGFFQLLFCQFPLIIIYANSVDRRFKSHIGLAEKNPIINLLFHTPFVLIITVEIALAYFFWQAYGTIAFLIGPLRTWSVILNMVLWYQAQKIPLKELRPAAEIWSSLEKMNEHQSN